MALVAASYSVAPASAADIASVVAAHLANATWLARAVVLVAAVIDRPGDLDPCVEVRPSLPPRPLLS